MSFGIKVGRFIGAAGAYAVEGAVRGATGLGGFAQEVAQGAEAGYVDKREALLIDRAERDAKREALKAAYIAKLAAGTVIKTEPTPVAAKTAKVRS